MRDVLETLRLPAAICVVVTVPLAITVAAFGYWLTALLMIAGLAVGLLGPGVAFGWLLERRCNPSHKCPNQAKKRHASG